MKSSVVKSGLGIALLCGALVSGAASANEPQQFSALGGVEAQALSAQEMDAIHGAVTASEILTAYQAALDRIVARSPRLASTAALLLQRVQTLLDRLVAKGLLQP